MISRISEFILHKNEAEAVARLLLIEEHKVEAEAGSSQINESVFYVDDSSYEIGTPKVVEDHRLSSAESFV